MNTAETGHDQRNGLVGQANADADKPVPGTGVNGAVIPNSGDDTTQKVMKMTSEKVRTEDGNALAGLASIGADGPTPGEEVNSELAPSGGNDQGPTAPAAPRELALRDPDAASGVVVTQDSTSIAEVARHVTNGGALEQVIQDMVQFLDVPPELQELPTEGGDVFLSALQDRVDRLMQADIALEIHGNLWRTRCAVGIGRHLAHGRRFFDVAGANRGQSTKERKDAFLDWRNSTFGGRYNPRTLQLYEQIARMGPFAETYACLGLERLKYLLRLVESKHQGNPEMYPPLLEGCPDLMAYIPTDDDDQGQIDAFRRHADRRILQLRFHKAQLKFVTIEHCGKLTDELGAKTVPQGTVGEIAGVLNGRHKGDPDAQQALLEEYLENKCQWPMGEQGTPDEEDQAEESTDTGAKLGEGLARPFARILEYYEGDFADSDEETRARAKETWRETLSLGQVKRLRQILDDVETELKTHSEEAA